MKIILISILLIISKSAFSQGNQIILKASSISVDIKIGKELFKNAWTLMPEIKPDIYVTNSKKVTFYTNLESKEFILKKNEVINFIILLNNKDTAYTQIKQDPNYKPNGTISYLSILQKAKKYDSKDVSVFPKYTYQSKGDPKLIQLRKEYNLDSIAGQGNEVSKILNLLHWVHTTIPHDGQHSNPDIKNALSMIPECKKDNRGLNCRGLAITLNECYLAMGIKSHYVTCMPKDSIFDDCHVINSVFSTELNKWLYIDPTNDAYVMNENGELLSIQEVRERLINGKPLILNPTANWNNKQSTLKEEYLYNYMAKNLYRIECPISSEFDIETFKNGEAYKTIQLLPLDAYNHTIKMTQSFNKYFNMLFINYTTNNPDLFWEIPLK